MTKKGSYFQKHLAQLGEDAPKRQALPIVKIAVEKKTEFEEGKVILLDKPLHWTSFDAVRKIRNTIGIKKVGHAGTLDPLATGLLIICTGKQTKMINEYMAQVKEYTGTITLGAITPTYDLESLPEQHKDFTHLTVQQINEAVQTFLGETDQFPPIYSAIKKKGTPLYELARRGEEIELKSRKINISVFEITSIDLPFVHFRIVCSTGTYIRSIANDLGAKLACGGYLSALRRTAIGSFRVEEAVSMEGFLAECGHVTE